MSVRRALLGCAVLSVQDACVFYPCCKCCMSRLDVEQHDTTRFRCWKCGYRCFREQVEYRYRLSLRVTRGTSIFGVTVFGTCLNQFFGIPASGLQRLVENVDGPVGASSRAKLLMKAVKDCFIGRHFIFGVKVTGTESRLSFVGPGIRSDRVQFIANQMTLPKAPGLAGSTVVSYYQHLLQKAAAYELESNDPDRTSRPPATDASLSGSSFNNATLSPSSLLLQTLQWSQHQDCTLNPTPPWQQSLGLVTSSAEQEEGSTQGNGDENSQQPVNDKLRVTKERNMSLLSLEHSPCSSPSSVAHPYMSIEKAAENCPLAKTLLSPSQPGREKDLSPRGRTKGFSASHLTKTFLSSSLAWEDLPFSESLTEFLYVERKDIDIVRDAEPHPNMQTHKGTVSNDLDKNPSVIVPSVCQNKSWLTENHSWILQDITNVPNNRGDEKSLTFENKEQEHEGDSYNCSVDLFGSSFMTDADRKTFSMQSETAKVTKTSPLLSTADKQHLRSEKAKVEHSTPNKHTLKNIKSINRDSFTLQGIPDFDFSPPVQSTPIFKVVSGKPDRNKNPPEAQQYLGAKRGALNLGSLAGMDHKCDSAVYDVTVCDYEEREVIVPPTPVAKTQLNVKLKRRRQSECSSTNLYSSRMQPGRGTTCKKKLLDHHLSVVMSSQGELTANSDLVVVDEGRADGLNDYPIYDDNQPCDWSKDLFSDSI